MSGTSRTTGRSTIGCRSTTACALRIRERTTTRSCRRRTSSSIRWQASAAPNLYVPGCSVATRPCPAASRVAVNPATGASLGPSTQVAIGTLVPGSGDPYNGIVVAGDGIAKTNYTWPTLGFAPRFGAAYDVSGTQRMVVRGGFGVFYDRLNGNTVYNQVGNPPDRQVHERPERQPADARTVRLGHADAVFDDGLLLRFEAADIAAVEHRHADDAAVVIIARRVVRRQPLVQHPRREPRHQLAGSRLCVSRDRTRIRRYRARRPAPRR